MAEQSQVLYWPDKPLGIQQLVRMRITWSDEGVAKGLPNMEDLKMALVNPFKKMIAKGIDAGADGARRAVRISNRSDRPINYNYTFEISGVAQVVKEEGTDVSISLKPATPQVIGDAGAGISRSGTADGTFTYKMSVTFGMAEVAKSDTDEPED